jgi:hypothetical protein
VEASGCVARWRNGTFGAMPGVTVSQTWQFGMRAGTVTDSNTIPLPPSGSWWRTYFVMDGSTHTLNKPPWHRLCSFRLQVQRGTHVSCITTVPYDRLHVRHEGQLAMVRIPFLPLSTPLEKDIHRRRGSSRPQVSVLAAPPLYTCPLLDCPC